MGAPTVVIKVGGSLFELADLGPRLRRFLATIHKLPVLLVPGGGKVVDVIRDLDRRHGLGEEEAHWLALRALSVNAHFLAHLLAPACIVADLHDSAALFAAGVLSVLDGYAFAQLDESRHPDQAVPHGWSATSDSLAARAASVVGASRLILLKSVTIPQEMDWHEAAQRGWVDAVFPEMIARSGRAYVVEAINLSEWQLGAWLRDGERA